MRSGIHPADVTFKFRPIEKWTQPVRETKSCRFRSSISTTQSDLKCELATIGVDECVIQADLDESDIRLDGIPRANARYKSSRVIVSFTHPEQGDISFPCGTYHDLWDNIRGIVKTMEALRAIDRYGVTKNSQQYTGWKQLPSNAIVLQEFSSVEEAASFILDTAIGLDECLQYHHNAMLNNGPFRREMYHAAASMAHPDKGGSVQKMTKLNKARDMIAEHIKRERA